MVSDHGARQRAGRDAHQLHAGGAVGIADDAGPLPEAAAKAGAGTLVPITGFANAVVSAAIEFKTEGRVLGTGAKMFIIAGPVIVYGTLAAVLYGSVYWLLQYKSPPAKDTHKEARKLHFHTKIQYTTKNR